jgi:hypothetical protein
MFRVEFLDDYANLKPLFDYKELSDLINLNESSLDPEKVKKFRERFKTESSSDGPEVNQSPSAKRNTAPLLRFSMSLVLQIMDGLCQLSQSTRLYGVPSVLEAYYCALGCRERLLVENCFAVSGFLPDISGRPPGYNNRRTRQGN